MTYTLSRTNGRVSDPRSFFQNVIGVDPIQFTPGQFAMEVQRTDDGFHVVIPVPGYDREQLSVTVDETTVNIRAKSPERTMSRSFTMPPDVDTESITTNLKNGMLTIRLSVHQKPQPREIPISTE